MRRFWKRHAGLLPWKAEETEEEGAGAVRRAAGEPAEVSKNLRKPGTGTEKHAHRALTGRKERTGEPNYM